MATIKFGANIFLRWYLEKKNCKHRYHDVKVKSLKWQSTLGLLLKPGTGPEKPGPKKPRPWKTDSEKHGINMELKNISPFREFNNKENVQCDL